MNTNWKWEGYKCGRQKPHLDPYDHQFHNPWDKRKAERLFWKGLLQGIPEHREPLGIWIDGRYC